MKEIRILRFLAKLSLIIAACWLVVMGIVALIALANEGPPENIGGVIFFFVFGAVFILASWFYSKWRLSDENSEKLSGEIICKGMLDITRKIGRFLFGGKTQGN